MKENDTTKNKLEIDHRPNKKLYAFWKIVLKSEKSCTRKSYILEIMHLTKILYFTYMYAIYILVNTYHIFNAIQR